MDKSSVIKNNLLESIKLKQQILEDEKIMSQIVHVSELIITAYEKGNKVLFCGNGGSAADAQHLAAELSGRYYFDREPLNSEALHVNTSYLTAVANDYSYNEVYARLVRATMQEGDILIGLSTSGNSANVVNALKEAGKRNCITISLTGAGGGKMKHCSDITISIHSKDTPRIQECHMIIGHSICEIVEEELFGKK